MKKIFTLTMLLLCAVVGAKGEATVVGYTEAINGTSLDARVLSVGGLENLSITGPSFGSAITDQGSKTVYIDGTTYTNVKSWRKSVKDAYDNQNIGYRLTVASGYKMNISKVNARIAVADDTYTWYVEILNSVGTQVWKSSERTTTKASSGKIDNVDVTDKEDIQGLTGTVTVNLWVKQGGSTKYFSINYLQLSVELEEDSRPNYTITANVADGQTTYGSIDKDGDNSVPEGDAISLTATANAGYAFINWTKDNVEVSTNATLALSSVTANATYVANFKKLYRATYNLGEYAGTLTGKVLCSYNAANNVNEIYADKDDNYTIPAYAHKYLYREGYAFAGWSYGGNIYDSGDEITGLTEDPTITPTWIATTQALSNSYATTEVAWSFAKADIIFMDWQSSDKYGYYTQNVTVNGETIAIPMQITKGKVGNYTRSDALAQTNQNTQFTIPAVSGMTVSISGAYKEISTTTIAGSTDYTGTGTKSISYKYNGSDETIDIIIGESGQYLTSIVVTYPQTIASVSKTISAAGYATLCSEYPLNFTGSGVKAYIATIEDKSVKFTEVTSVPANTGVLLKGTEGNKTISVAASSTDVSANKLIGVTEETEVDGPIFVLMAPTSSPIGFYKTTAASFTVGANTAYLPASVVSGARMFIGFDDNEEVTGINALLNEKGEMVNDKFIYNLNGQRVKNASKGLYIKNGKKIFVK